MHSYLIHDLISVEADEEIHPGSRFQAERKIHIETRLTEIVQHTL